MDQSKSWKRHGSGNNGKSSSTNSVISNDYEELMSLLQGTECSYKKFRSQEYADKEELQGYLAHEKHRALGTVLL